MPDPNDPIDTVVTPKNQHASVAGNTDETTPHGSGATRFGAPAAPDEVGTLGPYRVVETAERRAREDAGRAEAVRTARGERPPWLVAPFDRDRARTAQRHWAVYLGVSATETFTVGEAAAGRGWGLLGRAKPVQMTFVFVPPGTFWMGSEDGHENEKPVHQVTLTRGFFMAATPVTQAQWRAVMGQEHSHRTFKGPDLPLDGVTTDACRAFCGRLAEAVSGRGEFRLPTEAEWEYACRAGAATHYHSGNDAAALAKVGWYKGNSGTSTRPVGQLAPNAWGLHDMHGNVWEWVQDYEGPYPREHAEDPTGPARGLFRVLRGGSWAFGAKSCRASVRNWFEESRGGAPTPSDLRGAPKEPNDDIGFRPVLTLPPD